jgi:hypothetical protein
MTSPVHHRKHIFKATIFLTHQISNRTLMIPK